MISIFEHLEDHDNAELPYYDWFEQLCDAVRDYNDEYDTNYPPKKTVNDYIKYQEQENLE